MIVDVHAHVIPSEMTRTAADEERWRPRVFDQEGHQVIELGGREIRSAVREFVDVGRILEQEETAGVDHVVLSPWVALLCYDLEPAEGLRVARIQNEALARLCRQRPDRLSAVGTVPLQDPPRAAEELVTLMKEPGMRGVELSASARGVYLGDHRFRPLWEAAEETGAVIFIHPTTRGFDLPVFEEYYLWNTVANPMETTVTAAHMVMAGVLEDHPGLRVVLAHGGGAITALRGRLRHAHSFQPQARERLGGSVDESIRRFHFDSITHDPNVLRELIAFAGPERILLGSDHPFDMGVERPVEEVRSVGLSPEDEAAILGGNAIRLYGLDG